MGNSIKTKSFGPEFIVQYCSNWDGGAQERDAAVKFVKEAAPSAKVSNRQVDKYPVTVCIFRVECGEEKEIFSCRQEDLFKKNKWPAKDKLKAAVSESIKVKKDEAMENSESKGDSSTNKIKSGWYPGKYLGASVDSTAWSWSRRGMMRGETRLWNQTYSCCLFNTRFVLFTLNEATQIL